MGLETFNKRSRAALWHMLSGMRFDLLVIGGGITGASIFRDAALRGMRVALVEARDFASATSSRSSKLIHGGLRYIKNLGLRLAWESCHERDLHVRLNKRLVRPLPFLMPLFRGRGHSRAMLRLGMALYELLSGFRNHRFHRFLSREETLQMAPGLPGEGLTSGCLYYDAAVSDGRWTMEILKDGVRNGGVAINYAPVAGLIREGESVAGAVVEDKLSGERREIRARAVVNATGVFADAIRRMDNPAAPSLIRLSKGTHLVFAEEDVPLSVTTVFTSPLDGRPLFLIKREGCFLYGTTDDWEDGDCAAPIPGKRDVEYLLESLRRFMPAAGLGREKVQFAYSGFRPLLVPTGADHDPANASREDHIETATSGLISVIGGKMTTARLMAIRVLDRVFAQIGRDRNWTTCHTHKLSIGGSNEDVAEGLAHWVRQCPRLTGYFRILFQRYGLDAHGICGEALRIASGRHPEPWAEPIRAEVQYVCRHEMICTLEDLMDRRAGFLHWNIEKRLERLRHGRQVIREELDLSESDFDAQYAEYEARLRRFHSVGVLESGVTGRRPACVTN